MTEERRSNDCQHKFQYSIGEKSPGIFIIACTECSVKVEKTWAELRTDDRKKILDWVGCN